MQIKPSIYWVNPDNSADGGEYRSNTYLIGSHDSASSDGLILIDPGPSDDLVIQRIMEYAHQLGKPIRDIILTHAHPDHSLAAPEIRRLTQARLHVHQLERHNIERWGGWDEQVDVWYGEAAGWLDLPQRLWYAHTPGHSPGHMVLFYPTAQAQSWQDAGALFSGDMVLGAGTVAIIPPQGHLRQYLDSLVDLLNFRPDIVLPGHGPVFTQLADKVQEYIVRRKQREAQILALLAAGPRSSGSLMADIYADIRPDFRFFAESTIRAHLEKLMEDGLVTTIKNGENEQAEHLQYARLPLP
ncbi:MAG: MBL fold metallo-hydrolase [Chloroflexi bacterium]|nr:MBL fold metallo-hydrolase [Chloroflexota bacterium]